LINPQRCLYSISHPLANQCPIAEVGLLIIAFTVLNGLVGICFKLLTAKWFKEQAERLLTLRQNIGLLLLLLVCVGLCILLVSVSGVLIYQGKSVQAFQLNLVRSIPVEFWVRLATAIAKCILLLLLVKFCLPLLHQVLTAVFNWVKHNSNNG
jgi:4-hydroxybenzoate polyprenyltransferase